MTNKNLEIGKILVPDKDAADRLKRTLIQSADSASTRRNRQHFWKKFKEWWFSEPVIIRSLTLKKSSISSKH